MIAIIDYDAGNLRSVEKAFQYLGASPIITRDPAQILSADKVILPGVGSFGDAMAKLQQYPDKAAAIRTSLQMIAQAEEDRTAYSETPANAFGGLMADLFTVKEDRWTPVLRQFGRSLGKLIYFMDAACDLEADRKKNQYNPLALLGIQSGADFRPQLTLLAGDAAEAFECLPIVQDAALLQNILYSGVWTRFDAAFAAKQEGQT